MLSHIFHFFFLAIAKGLALLSVSCVAQIWEHETTDNKIGPNIIHVAFSQVCEWKVFEIASYSNGLKMFLFSQNLLMESNLCAKKSIGLITLTQGLFFLLLFQIIVSYAYQL